jgi:ADP-heptose:LPS heptosyltransferase
MADIVKRGGYGDAIMASVHDPKKPWYIKSKTRSKCFFNLDFRVKRGILNLAPALIEWADRNAPKNFVLFEPYVKEKYSADNKQWGFEKWRELVRRSPFPLVQCLAPGASPFPGPQHIVDTPTFFHACAVLNQSLGFVGPEGGLHHVAGALRKRGVIIFGAFNLPEMFGYDDHVNLSRPDKNGLGQRQSNAACRAAMDKISVDEVLAAMKERFS